MTKELVKKSNDEVFEECRVLAKDCGHFVFKRYDTRKCRLVYLLYRVEAPRNVRVLVSQNIHTIRARLKRK